MRRAVLVIIGVVLLTIPVAQTQTSVGTAADEAAIERHREAHIAAWNKHDAQAVAALYAADADHVNQTGSRSGRAEIEGYYASQFDGVNKNATLKDESTKTRFLTREVAIVDFEDAVTGRTDGTVKNHGAEIYVKRNGAWALVAQRVIRKQ